MVLKAYTQKGFLVINSRPQILRPALSNHLGNFKKLQMSRPLPYRFWLSGSGEGLCVLLFNTSPHTVTCSHHLPSAEQPRGHAMWMRSFLGSESHLLFPSLERSYHSPSTLLKETFGSYSGCLPLPNVSQSPAILSALPNTAYNL